MNKYRIKDLMNVNRGSSPRPIMEYLSDSGLRWLKISDFKLYDRYVYDTKEFIKESGLKNTRHLPSGTLILTNSATPGIPIFLGRDMCLHDGFLYFTNLKEDIININYLYYWFLFNRDSIINQANGSVFKNLKKEIVENQEIKLPDLKSQLKIVKILDNINRKIELNNEINNNLHGLCKNMYLELLSQLDESNSSIKQIKEVSKCVLGGTPSRAKSEYWNGNINWINSGEVNKFRIIEASETITDLGLQKSSTTLLPKETTVLAITGATLGQVSRLEIDSCANQSVIGVIPNNVELNNYIYLSILNTINDLILKQTGGAQQHINKNDVETHEIIIPDDELVKEFDEKTRPIFNKISLTCFENKKLEQLRDTLLPKLMNGEVSINGIDV